MKRARSIPILVVLLVCACSALTAKKTSTWMNSMYNAQYNEYLTWFEKDAEGNWKTKDSVTERQKEILRIKKRIFTELHPLLEAYAIYASTKSAPKGFNMDLVEGRIVELINRLVSLSIEKEGAKDARPSSSLDNISRDSQGNSADSPVIGYE